MPRLKRLSGKDIVRSLRQFGFSLAGQKGSHMRVVRIVDGSKQVVIVPNHKELDRGTTTSIFKHVLRYIPEQDLKSHFYTE